LDDFFTYIFTNSSGNTFAPYVSSIDLSYNQFSGNLMGLNGSGAFQTAVSLEELLISNNELSGELPDLSSFSELKTLDLSSNQLNGSLSPSIWSITNLNMLDLSENNFSNNLPIINESIEGQCPKSLTYLSMAGNSFSGPFPSQLFNYLQKLQIINFDRNAFNGVLNMTINTSLTGTTLFSIVENKISELMPSWDSGKYTPVL
jgi:Leucine-rich repeat (LRR) protein